MSPGTGTDPSAGREPSIFDEDPDLFRQQRRRELRRIRSALVTSGFLIILPAVIGRLRTGGVSHLTEPLFAGYVLAIVIAYWCLGYASMRRPFTALLAGVFIYLLLQALIYWTAPASLLAGWIFRVIVLLNLIMPLQKAKALQQG